jgi:hypothetical protein
MRYDRARKNLDRHPNYILAAYMASGTYLAPAKRSAIVPMSGRGTRRGVRQATVSPAARRRGEEQGSGD